MQKTPNPSKASTGKDKDALLERINDFGQILQNFGLNLIQSIGEMKHTLGILTDKVEQIDHELISIKGLKTSLQDLDKFRRDVSEDFSEIKAQLNSMIGKMPAEGNKFSSASLDQSSPNLDTPLAVLEDFENKVQNGNSVTEIRTDINTVKEQLYILTGGHKILFELREFDRKIDPSSDIIDDLKASLLEKISEWKTVL
jgi:hypothetical protein